MLVNVSPELAAVVAAGLGMTVPKAMRKGLEHAARRRSSPQSAARSLMALQCDDIRSRRVAILLADGLVAAAAMDPRRCGRFHLLENIGTPNVRQLRLRAVLPVNPK